MKSKINQKSIFLTLALTCIILNIIALIFQYGFGMEPCIMCIYQRIILAAITPVLLLCAFAKTPLVFIAGAFTTLTGFIYGAKISYTHAFNQLNINPFASCSFRPELYDYIPLDKIIPSVFEVRAACDQINWIFLNLTMPQWLHYIYVALIGWVVIGCIKFIKQNKNSK